MATWYVDPTIVSAGGTGDGSLGDPWGRTTDPIQYAVDQVAATVGPNSDGVGDIFRIVDGPIVNTTSLDMTAWPPSVANPVHFLAHDPDALITWDLGGLRLTTISHGGMVFGRFSFDNPPLAGAPLTPSGFGSLYYQCVVDFSAYAVTTGFFSGAAGIRDSVIKGTTTSPTLIPVSSLFVNNYVEVTGAVANVINGTDIYIGNNVFVLDDDVGSLLDGTNNVKMYNNTIVGGANSSGLIDLAWFAAGFEFINNYIEGAGTIITLATGGRHNFNIAGNKAYNSLQGIASESSKFTVLIEDNDWNMAASGLKDAAGGDYRPNHNLIGAGWRNDNSGIGQMGQAPTVGALDRETGGRLIGAGGGLIG